MLNAQQEYVNVISRHQVIQKDKNGKAWMIMGVMDLSPDQTPMERIKRTIINRKTGEILASAVVPADQQLIKREKEILLLIRQDRKSTRLNSSHRSLSRMPSSA